MTGFRNINSIIVPRTIIQQGQNFLRVTGKSGREGLVLWVGRKQGLEFTVTDLVVPEQRGVKTADGICVIIEGYALARLNSELYKRNLQLIAQIHSHPGIAFHSKTDDEYAIATKVGCLSLVVPDFAVRPFLLSECAIYRLSAEGKWVGLSTNAVNILIKITTDKGRYYGAG